MELEIFFYCLGMIPPITQLIGSNSKQSASQFIDNNFIGLFVDQLKDFYYKQQNFVHLTSPLMLAIRALVAKSEEMKKEVCSS